MKRKRFLNNTRGQLMKKLYFYLYLFGLLCAAEHSHGSEKNIEPKIKYFISAKQGDQTKKVEIDRFHLEQFGTFKKNFFFEYETKKQFENTKLKELVKPEEYYRKEENKKKTVKVIKNNDGDIEATWDITQLLENAFPKITLKHKDILLNLLVSASYGKKSIKNDEPISELKKSDLITACKLADITGNSRISKFAGFSLIKKLTGQELFEIEKHKNPHEYYINKIEFLPGTNGSEFVSSKLEKTFVSSKLEKTKECNSMKSYYNKNMESYYEWIFDITHWKKDGNNFKPKVLLKSKSIDYTPNVFTLGENKLITYGHAGGNAFIWQKDKDNETFKKTKLDSNGYIIYEIKVAPWFNEQMFIAGLRNSDRSSSKLQLCKVEGKKLKTIIDLGTEKYTLDHYANFADDKEIVIYCSSNQGNFLWEWSEGKKIFLKKKISKSNIYNYTKIVNFLPGTKGQELIFQSNQNSSLYKLDRNNLEIKNKFNNVMNHHNIYFVPGTKGQEFFAHSDNGELLFFKIAIFTLPHKQLQKSSGRKSRWNDIKTKTFTQNPQNPNEFLFFFSFPPTKQTWKKTNGSIKLKKTENVKSITDFTFVPETTGLEHIIATYEKIEYVSPKLLPFKQLELCYSIFEKDKYPLEKNEKATLNNLPKNIQKLAKEKLKKQTKKI